MKKGIIPLKCPKCGGTIKAIRKKNIDFRNYRFIGSRSSQQSAVEYKCCRCGKIQ